MSRDDRPDLVFRCVCTGYEFFRVVDVANRTGVADVAELQGELPVGTGCGLCVPYVQRSIETGAIGHPLLDERELEEYSARSGIVDDPEVGGGEERV